MKEIIICLLTMAALVSGCNNSGIGEIDEQEMLEELRTDITYLASDELEGRETGTEGERLAADYIAKRMQALGLEPMGDDGTYFQHFSVAGQDPHGGHFSGDSDSTVEARNVVGFLDRGANMTVVVGAHYDHLGYGDAFGSLHDGPREIHNGADDNASGVAAMLQIAELCIDDHESHNFLFIAFSGEEKGLWGSNYFVKNATIPLEQINYMINLDMVGRLNEEKKLSINSVGTSPQWMPALEQIEVDSISIVTTGGGIGGSDHTSFYLEEVPALHFFTGQHEQYHKPSDDPELINYMGIISIVTYIDELIEELEDDGELAFEETDEPQQTARDFSVTLGVMPDYLYDKKGMRIDGIRSDRPAAKGGLEKGDIVIQMGELEIEGMESYMQALNTFEPGQQITVRVKRGDEILEKQVTFD